MKLSMVFGLLAVGIMFFLGQKRYDEVNVWGDLQPLVIIGVPADSRTARGQYYTALACHLHEFGYYPIFENGKFFIDPKCPCKERINQLAQEQETAKFQAKQEQYLPLLYPHWLTNTTFTGSKKILYTVFERETLPTEHISLLESFDGILTASHYNKKLLQNLLPNKNILVAPQGIITDLYPPHKLHQSEVFTIYSAGKLEFRKGQDLVVEAFKRFRLRNHIPSRLIGIWGNKWNQSMQTIACSQYTSGYPKQLGKDLDFESWLLQNDLEKDSFVIYNYLDHSSISQIHKSVSVAVFPNRCESGTNMFAAEALSSGIPTIITNITGHRDLLTYQHPSQLPWVYSLSAQQKSLCHSYQSVALPGNWYEPLVDDIVKELEKVYANRESAFQTGERASEVIHKFHNHRTSAQYFANSLSQLLSN